MRARHGTTHTDDALRAAIIDACPCGNTDGGFQPAAGQGFHKWQIFRAICTARPKLGVSERALAVLNALLSFYPETTLSGDDELIVFPSNEQLCLRTHGMPASTLRRLLAVLVDA